MIIPGQCLNPLNYYLFMRQRFLNLYVVLFIAAVWFYDCTSPVGTGHYGTTTEVRAPAYPLVTMAGEEAWEGKIYPEADCYEMGTDRL